MTELRISRPDGIQLDYKGRNSGSERHGRLTYPIKEQLIHDKKDVIRCSAEVTKYCKFRITAEQNGMPRSDGLSSLLE